MRDSSICLTLSLTHHPQITPGERVCVWGGARDELPLSKRILQRWPQLIFNLRVI